MTACPKCGADAPCRKTVAPWPGELARRQRRCAGCGAVFWTRETPINLAGALPPTGDVAGTHQMPDSLAADLRAWLAMADNARVPEARA